MKKQVTLSSYRNRVLSVIDYVWTHIDQDLDLNTLAEIAHFSPYHFHRIYRGLMHETVSASVRRLRLHRAAAELLRTEHTIEHIAQSLNYGSMEAFSRAFSRHYGESPSAFRLKKARWQDLKHPISNVPQPRSDTMNFPVSIENIDTISLVGLPHRGDYNNISPVFEKLYLMAQNHNLLTKDTRSMGIYYDDPSAGNRDDMRSHACISASATSADNNEFEALKVGGGPHAVMTFVGPYAELEEAYEWFYGHWLPQSGYDTADAPPFEEYLNDPKTTAPAELKTLVYLPLEKV